MVRRHARSPVAPSAYVFPGGTVRDDDVSPVASDGLADALSARSDSPVSSAEAGLFYVSAVRELFEEAGVLLARDSCGCLVTVDQSDEPFQERLASTRLALQARNLSLASVFAEWGWQDRKSTRLNSSHQIISYAVF